MKITVTITKSFESDGSESDEDITNLYMDDPNEFLNQSEWKIEREDE